ncbi:diaminopimelate epimerase [Spiribacter vilamensis]|uniref:Diaminopimelate epimerase n=1 Tax=Spiribacter vilamensis TaxID=531306 RepID=A0A4Q8D2G5_9GAMM|nr:diaminopimelate epimerase [Spiribacter vilamensis]RZU99497.1 diaminopimelate epimerase [Spiribacter vilamensis]TVO61530.1 diaminopimelate epimerase [Spiribacter vilamensis]
MSLAFTKMQGLGNDFVVFDAINQSLDPTPAWIRRIADRRYGVGCDQVLVAEAARRPDADFRYRIWNADGHEVEHCGNGVRCLARFLRDQGLHRGGHVSLETDAGLTRVELMDDGRVRVDMGAPILEPSAIPFEAAERRIQYELTAAGVNHDVAAVSMGNPHVILRVDDVETAPVATLGPALESHPRFPNRVNAGFLAVDSRSRGHLRVYERGVGETPACGTGACAAAVAGILNDWFDPTVTLSLTGGELVLHWQGEGQPVWMTGPADTVFEGRLATGAT